MVLRWILNAFGMLTKQAVPSALEVDGFSHCVDQETSIKSLVIVKNKSQHYVQLMLQVISYLPCMYSLANDLSTIRLKAEFQVLI